MNYKEIRTGIEEEKGTRWLQRMVSAFRFLFVILLTLGLVLYFYPSDRAQVALSQKIDVLKRERAALQTERDAQIRKLDWIKSDDKYLEIAARDRLGLQKDGEFVIRFQSKEKSVQK